MKNIVLNVKLVLMGGMTIAVCVGFLWLVLSQGWVWHMLGLVVTLGACWIVGFAWAISLGWFEEGEDA